MPTTRAAYVWELSGDIFRDVDGEQDNFLRIMQAGGFTIAYMQFYENQLRDEGAAIEAFVARANALGIQIHGLLGYRGVTPTLDTPSNLGGGGTQRSYYEAFLGYNIAHPAAPITGFNWDFEPLHGNMTKMRDYMRAAKLVSVSGQTMVSQGWILSIYADAPYYLADPRGDLVGVLAATDMYREFDVICINSYWNSLQGIISHAADGPAVCQAEGIDFLIGMESTDLSNTTLTLWNAGKEYYEATVLPGLDSVFGSLSRYQGTYLHHMAGGINRWWMMESVTFPGSTAYDPAVLPVVLEVTVDLKLLHYDSRYAYGIKVSLVGPTTYTGSKILALSPMEGDSVVVPVTIPAGAPPGAYSIVVDTWQLDSWDWGYPRASILLSNITEAELEALTMPQLEALNIVGARNPFVRLDYANSSSVITVEETVTPPEKHTLFMSAVGNGTTNPAPGSYEVDEGEEVILTAIPDVGFQFVGWSGSFSATSLSVAVVISGDTTAVATFEKIPEPEPSTDSIMSIAVTMTMLIAMITEMAEVIEVGAME